MTLFCKRCFSVLRREARFCSRCGEPVLHTPEPALPPEPAAPAKHAAPAGACCTPKSIKQPGRSRASIRDSMFFPLMWAALVASCFFVIPRLLRHQPARVLGQATWLEIDRLGEAPLNAIYDLLRPESVRVTAVFSDGELTILGNPDDLRSVSEFAELLRRGAKSNERAPRRPRGESQLTRRLHQLSKIDAHAMARALSFTDWQVRFVVDGRRLTVTAPEEDQRVIASMVSLLNND